MKKLLLITGDLAAGKSTFSEILAERYKACVFRKDEIKETLSDALEDLIDTADRAQNLKLSAAVASMMYYNLDRMAKRGPDILLESNFRQRELDVMHDIAAQYGYDVLTIVLRGDIDLLHVRYLERIRSGKRHPVHLSTTFEIREDFAAYLQAARQIEYTGDVLNICADDFSYQTDPVILARIDAFMQA